jgi:hypothetical protein
MYIFNKDILNQYCLNNKIFSLIFAMVTVILIFFTSSIVYADDYDWDIFSFDTDITVQEDGTLHIKETIVADFSKEEHHGIYRNIPVEYKDSAGKKLTLEYKINSVTDEKGNNWWYEESRIGEYVNIKAGDPDSYQNKPTTFIIDYEIVRAVSHQFDDQDEIYWNATGNEWEVSIKNASTTIHFPDTIKPDDLQATCYTGKYGSTEQECTSTIADNTIIYKTLGELNPMEGLTIVAGFPKGIVNPPASIQPTSVQPTIWIPTDNWLYKIFILIFIQL